MKATILYDDRVTEDAAATGDGGQLWLEPGDFHAATGWKLEPEGLCRGDACVRLNDGWRDDSGRIDLTAFADHMGQPVVRKRGERCVGRSVNP